MTRFTGKTVLITGAGSGIGSAAIRRFRDEGASVVAGDLTAPEGLDANCLSIQLDVTSEADWRAAILATEARFGALNVLVNNAGIGHAGPLESLSLADWRRVTAVNLDGVFLGIRHGAPALRRAGGGAIVNVASMMGSVAARNASAYCASKAAVLGLTRAAALELAADGIRVTALQPGYVETPLLANRLANDPALREALISATPAGRLASAPEVAGMLAFLASDESAFITGAGLIADGGYTAR